MTASQEAAPFLVAAFYAFTPLDSQRLEALLTDLPL